MAQRPPVAALYALGFGAVYALAILVGRATRIDDSQISLIWPAAAVAVIWGLHAQSVGGRLAVLHWSALVAVNFTTTLLSDGDFGLALWFALVNVALAGVTVLLLQPASGAVGLRHPGDLGRLFLAVTAGGVVSGILAAGYFGVRDQDAFGNVIQVFVHFEVRNGVSTLAGVALFLQAREIRRPLRLPPPTKMVEPAASAVAVTVLLVLLFWINTGLPLAFMTLVPAMWVGFRYTTTYGVVFINLSACLIVWATLQDRGVFMGLDPMVQALLSQLLIGTITVIVLTLSLVRDSRNELIAELRHVARHDQLTRLANRGLLLERLDVALDRATLLAPVGLVYVDLDGFKTVNDAWGHQEGDLLLVEIASRLRALAQPTDTVARMGGDEFVVVRPAVTDQSELDLLAERIRDAVERPYGQAIDAPFDRVSASIGTAVSDRTSTARSLLHDADQAMYDAKRATQSAPPQGERTAPGFSC